MFHSIFADAVKEEPELNIPCEKRNECEESMHCLQAGEKVGIVEDVSIEHDDVEVHFYEFLGRQMMRVKKEPEPEPSSDEEMLEEQPEPDSSCNEVKIKQEPEQGSSYYEDGGAIFVKVEENNTGNYYNEEEAGPEMPSTSSIPPEESTLSSSEDEGSLPQEHRNDEQNEALAKKKRRHYCQFCKKLSMNISRHYVQQHADVPAVSKILSTKIHSQLRRTLLNKLRNEAIEELKKTAFRELLLPSGSESEPKDPCQYCEVLYNKRSLKRHYTVCAMKPRDPPSENGSSGSLDETNGSPEKKKHYCQFCKEMFINISRHYIKEHSDAPPIREILNIKMNVQLRRTLLAKLRYEAMEEYNRSASDSPKGSATEPRYPCKFCNIRLKKRSFYSHYKVCPMRHEDVPVEDDELSKYFIYEPIVSLSRKRKKHYCQFCKKMYINISRHYAQQHKEVEAVKRILETELNSQERKTLLTKLRDEAMEEYNRSLAPSGSETDAIFAYEPIMSLGGKRRKHYCQFCKKMYSNVSRHYLQQHSDIPEISEILSKNLDNQQRRTLLTKLRYEAMDEFNRKASNPLLVPRGSGTKSKYPCKFCKILLKKHSLYSHYKICPMRRDDISSIEQEEESIPLE